ncbi:hypothetical protein AAG570_004923 [Ranatra chinensis]|uniref:Uncharacterized protein n=1 Tax=Ranatra chinensis TaxID=642074 RepID=A0ABD0YH98_9HEMI
MEQGQVAGTAGRLLGVVSVSSATTVPPPSQPPPLAPAPSVVFKQPLLPAPGPSSVVPEAYKTLQQFRPKYCNRRGRGRHKSVVVQRMLPLLPKTNLVGSGGVGAVGAGSAKPGPPVVVTLQGVAAVEVSVGTPPTSPSRILKEGESQWLNSEVSDFSLSSFLGHLESSPLKGLSSGVTGGVQALPCVESHFHSLLAESSLDYTAKFADLAEKIAGRAVTTSGGGGVISDQAAPSVTHAATDPTVGS